MGKVKLKIAWDSVSECALCWMNIEFLEFGSILLLQMSWTAKTTPKASKRMGNWRLILRKKGKRKWNKCVWPYHRPSSPARTEKKLIIAHLNVTKIPPKWSDAIRSMRTQQTRDRRTICLHPQSLYIHRLLCTPCRTALFWSTVPPFKRKPLRWWRRLQQMQLCYNACMLCVVQSRGIYYIIYKIYSGTEFLSYLSWKCDE